MEVDRHQPPIEKVPDSQEEKEEIEKAIEGEFKDIDALFKNQGAIMEAQTVLTKGQTRLEDKIDDLKEYLDKKLKAGKF